MLAKRTSDNVMKLFASKNISIDLTLANERIKMQFRDQAMVSASLKNVLLDAEEDGRLTCGIYDSGTLLSKNPDNVMLCVLPEDSTNDVALHIHFTLIEAFCWENDIPILKVDSAEKIKKILNEIVEDENAGMTRWPLSIDYNCLLIEYPNDKPTTEEEDILEFSKVSAEAFPPVVLELDV